MREDAPGRENTRGHHLKIFKQRRNTVQRRKFFCHRVVDTWNDLPREVIEATTVNGFKGKLDKYVERERRELQQVQKLCTKSPPIYSLSYCDHTLCRTANTQHRFGGTYVPHRLHVLHIKNKTRQDHVSSYRLHQ